MQRDWANPGSKLQSKIHLSCGTADNCYFNNAVSPTEDILKSTSESPFDGIVDYRMDAERC